MSVLMVYVDDQPQAAGEKSADFSVIQAKLQAIGVRFERWTANCALAADADQQSVLAAYREPVEQLTQKYGFKSVDVVSLQPDHPDKAVFRQKFLAEHIHRDFEVRFFVEGKGLFYLHTAGKVYAVLCERGDLISVPAETKHWFDMGEHPCFKCIRLFTTEQGWQAEFTGSEIAKAFPSFDQYLAALS
jgi:1,2-dihydroxy-3-keto-5-methylthiopentene dioxygenase